MHFGIIELEEISSNVRSPIDKCAANARPVMEKLNINATIISLSFYSHVSPYGHRKFTAPVA